METSNKVTTIKNGKNRRKPTLEELAAEQNRQLKKLEARHQRQRKELLGEDNPEAAVVYQTVTVMQDKSQQDLITAATPQPDAETQPDKLEFNLVKNGLHYAEKNGEFCCREIMAIQTDFDQKYEGKIAGLVDAVLAKMKDKIRETYEAGDPRIEVGINAVERIAASCSNLKPLNRILSLLNDNIYYYDAELMRTKTKIWFWSELRQQFFMEHLFKFIPIQLMREIKHRPDMHFAGDANHFAVMLVDDAEEDQNIRYIITNKEAIKINDAFGYRYMDVNPATGKPFLRFRYHDYNQRGFFDGDRVMSLPQFYTCAPAVDFAGTDYKVNSSGNSIVNGYLYDQIDENIKIDPEKKKAPLDFFDYLMDNDPDKDRNTRDSAVMLDFFQQSQESMKKMAVGADHVIAIEGKIYQPKGYFKPSEKKLEDSGYVRYGQSEYVKL